MAATLNFPLPCAVTVKKAPVKAPATPHRRFELRTSAKLTFIRLMMGGAMVINLEVIAYTQGPACR